MSRFPIELRPLGSRVCLAALWGAASLSAIGMAHAQELDFTTGERDWLARHPVIRYGADPLWPPFSIREDNQLAGIDRSLLDLIETRLGTRFEYVPTTQWPENLDLLTRGEIDFVTGIADLPERPLDLLYTRSYAAFPVAMIMRTGGPFFTSLDQIEKEQILLAAPEGYAPTLHLERHHPSIPLILTSDSLAALRLVSSGKATAMVENLGVASHLIREHGLTNLKITGPTPFQFDPAFGVRRDLPELRSILEKAIASITPQERQHIYEEWVLVEIAGFWSARTVKTIALSTLGVSALAILLIALWNRRLGRELAARLAVEASLRQSEERFQHLFETMADACFVTRLDGHIQLANGAAAALLRIGSRPAISRLTLATFLKTPGEFTDLITRLRETERLRDHPLDFTDSEGRHHLCRCQIRLVRDSAGHESAIEWIARPGEGG